ncbi:MAG TPA: VOC family protein, partial [Pseudobdellovibrionaceae bacterium]|nr:VOC family protein [Pseudobdellovibrionaceae bacterium]
MGVVNGNLNTDSKISEKNPIGLNGVEFVEYTGPNVDFFENLFSRMAFKKVSSQHGRNIHLYRQGDINFIINGEPSTFANSFSKLHGPSICAVGFRVEDADYALKEALRRGAKQYNGSDLEKGATPFQAIYGVGDSLIYFMDNKNRKILYEKILPVSQQDLKPRGVGFSIVDHFTNNVPRGDMQKWCSFYENIFNFREIRYFDIRGEKTGLISRAMKSPCGLFSVPINEPTEQKSQIQEYLDEYKGSGIQHLALLTDDIVASLG